MEVSFSSSPGASSAPNEDFIAATPSAVVMLDGVTPFAELGSGCVHGTIWFVSQLGLRILSSVSVHPDVSLADALADAISDVAKLHVDTCDLGHAGTPSATTLILRESKTTVEYLALSDSVLVAELADRIEVVSDGRQQEFARPQREVTARHRVSSPEHGHLVRELVAEQWRYRNHPGGYWVASSNPQAAYESLVGSWPRDAIRSAALATDGASCLVDHFNMATWADLLHLLKQRGPQSLINEVREAEDLDPEGVRWPRYKRSDDATVALCRFRNDQHAD